MRIGQDTEHWEFTVILQLVWNAWSTSHDYHHLFLKKHLGITITRYFLGLIELPACRRAPIQVDDFLHI